MASPRRVSSAEDEPPINMNKNVNWMTDSKGFWVFYVSLIIAFRAVMVLVVPPEEAWTGVSIAHGVVSLADDDSKVVI